MICPPGLHDAICIFPLGVFQTTLELCPVAVVAQHNPLSSPFFSVAACSYENVQYDKILFLFSDPSLPTLMTYSFILDSDGSFTKAVIYRGKVCQSMLVSLR